VSKFLIALLPLAVACQGAPEPEPVEPSPAADPHAGHDHADCPHARTEAGSLHMDHGHSFEHAEKWAAIFDDPQRDTWQKPTELVVALGIQPGMAVADIGAGTGYFEPHLAGAVGAEGKVIALDPEPDMVAHMKARFEKDPLPQVEVRQSENADTKLTAGEADLLLMVNTYHHITERPVFFTKLAATLKPGGRLAVVDYSPGETPHGPPAAMRIAPETVKAELEGSGWVQSQVLDPLPEQFALIFTVASASAEAAVAE